jgi:uncharacterized protein YecT (DUF1311 family)
MAMKQVLMAALMLGAGMCGAEAADCKNAVTQFDLNGCADRDFRAADAQLNGAYRALTTKLEGADDIKARLVKAQRAWVAVRDAECDFMTSNSEGGSMHPMVLEGCRTTLTRKRTEQLNAYVTCMEADEDLLCPLP